MKNCRLCTIIRFFLAAVLLIIIISLSMSENLYYLSFITPWNAAFFVIGSGILLFLWKLYVYFKTKN